MKNFFKRTLALILALATVFSIGFTANAYSSEFVPIQSIGFYDEETGVFTVEKNIPNRRNPHCFEWHNIRDEIKSIVIKNGVKSIGQCAFLNCAGVESISFPATLERIGDKAFSNAGKNCSEPIEMDFPGSLSSIGNSAFSGSNIKNLVIPGRVEYIGSGAFGSSKIESLEILSSNTSIYEFAFSTCDNLETVKFPEGINIDKAAFTTRNYSIKTVYYTGSKESYLAMPVVTGSDALPRNAVFNCEATPYPVGISVGTEPDKTVYEPDEEFDPTGFELALEMTDGTTQLFGDISKMYIHDYYCTYKDESKVRKIAKYRVYVEYYGYRTELTYTTESDPCGKCGDNSEWVFDEESNTLIIRGTGEMQDYHNEWNGAPWNSYSDSIERIVVESGVTSIGKEAFIECSNAKEIHLPTSLEKIEEGNLENSTIESIYYSGTAENWSEISYNKSQIRDINLYFNGELHEHSYANDETSEPTCRHSGTLYHKCECGDFISESIPALPHTPGEWETDASGRTVKKCTGCPRVLEVKTAEPEEIPDEEPTQPEETPTEPEGETQEPETEENIGDEADGEDGVFEVIIDTIGKIVDAIASIFGKITGLFAF